MKDIIITLGGSIEGYKADTGTGQKDSSVGF